MKRLKVYIRDIPFIILLVNGISFVFAMSGIYFTDYWFIHEITGHNLLTVIYMGFFSYMHKACNYTIVSLVTMLLLNLLNIIYFFYTFEYYNVYAGIVIFSGIVLASIKFYQKWTKQDY